MYPYVRSYRFIAISTSYLNAAGFSEFFSVPVISQINFMGVGWTRGGWGEAGGRWEAEGRLKQPFGLKQHCCAFSVDTYLNWSNQRGAKTAVKSPHTVQQHWQKSSMKTDLAIYGQVLGVSG